MRYLQGETISMTIQSSDIKLSEINFTVWLYRHCDHTIKIKKEEMREVSEGEYEILINSSVTANFAAGRYFIEVVSEDDSVVISRAIAFEIVCCVSKGEL